MDEKGSYKGYTDKASYVEARCMNLEEQIRLMNGERNWTTIRLLTSWMLGLGFFAFGLAVAASVCMIGLNEGADWTNWELFGYTLLGCLSVAILAPIGGLIVTYLDPYRCF